MSNRIFKGGLLATTVIAGIGLAGPAFAQATVPAPTTTNSTPTPEDQTGSADNQAPAPGQATPGTTTNASGDDTIVVTGSLLRQPQKETASPVTVLTADALDDRGVNTVSDAVMSLSNNNAGTVPQGWNNGSNFATGANGISLRGLTVQDTLVIFDGVRSAPYPLADDGHRNFTDLNTIPDAIIDRIEVLRDGASSTYGSDAIAGVVNVITKKEIQGLHLNGSFGISQHGDGEEKRMDATYGFGSLADNRFNAYVSLEYQKEDKIWARDRGYPYNSADLGRYCLSDGDCGYNGVLNGVSADGSFNGLFQTPVPVLRIYNAAQTTALSPYFVPGNDCRGLDSVTLTPEQLDYNGVTGVYSPVQCQYDTINMDQQNQPEQTRYGISGRATWAINDNMEAYAQANFYQVQTNTSFTPGSFSGQTAGGQPTINGGRVAYSGFYLPVYVCGGVPAPRSRLTPCTAADVATGAHLNPYNPYAVDGYATRVIGMYDRPHTVEADARTYRVAGGISGTIFNDINYNVDGAISRVDLTINQNNYFNVRNLITAAQYGLYDFLNPANNTEAQRDFIAPPSSNQSTSQLKTIQATATKELVQLPGGPLQGAVGLAFRSESINNPSANPANLGDAYDRYQTINAVSVVGSRNVKSAFFELGAPVLNSLDLGVSGRYDKYSSGQKNFSPKFTAKFTPIRELALRATYSKGFRVPSFNEAFGDPTTGYITHQVDCTDPNNAAFCAAHGNNGYAKNSYAFGLTSIGNEGLKPEKSTSKTLGLVFQPIRQFSFTVDYYDILVKDLISNPDYSAVIDEYYRTGTTTNPNFQALGGIPDPANPLAQPLLGELVYQFQNANSLRSRGIDFSATGKFDFGFAKWTSFIEAAYLLRFEKKFDDPASTQRYDGTLSPCDVTSCSGAPKWRGSWQNTLDFGRFKTSLTSYYTSGYDLASIDYGGIKNDCEGSLGASVVGTTNGNPLRCNGKKFVYHDLTMSLDVGERFTLYANVLNVLNQKAPFDPSAAYGIYNYNVAWAQAGFIGRFFRMGAKVNF